MTDQNMQAECTLCSSAPVEQKPEMPDRPEGPRAPKDNMKDPKRLAALHKGACTSPRAETCPCPKKCPLHGRCCDCIRSHMDACREELSKGRDMGNAWFPECFKLATKGRFDGLGEIAY